MDPWLLYWGIALETQIWALDMLFIPCQCIPTYHNVYKFLNLIVITLINIKHRYKLNIYPYIEISLQ